MDGWHQKTPLCMQIFCTRLGKLDGGQRCKFSLFGTIQAGLIDGNKRDDLMTMEENVKSLIAKGKGYEIEAWEVCSQKRMIFMYWVGRPLVPKVL